MAHTHACTQLTIIVIILLLNILTYSHNLQLYSSATSYSYLYAIGLSLSNSMCSVAPCELSQIQCDFFTIISISSALYYHVTDYNATHIPRTNLLLVTLETAVGSYQDNGRLVNKRYFARHWNVLLWRPLPSCGSFIYLLPVGSRSRLRAYTPQEWLYIMYPENSTNCRQRWIYQAMIGVDQTI